MSTCQFLLIIQTVSQESLGEKYFSFTFELTKPLRKSVFSFLVWNCLFPFVQRIFWYFKLLFVELDFGKSPQTFSGALAGVSLKARSWRDFWIRLRRIFPISKYCQIFLKILFHVSSLSWSLTPPESTWKYIIWHLFENLLRKFQCIVTLQAAPRATRHKTSLLFTSFWSYFENILLLIIFWKYLVSALHYCLKTRLYVPSVIKHEISLFYVAFQLSRKMWLK